MAKCRLLYQENEDLGRMVSSGRLAKLEGELALQKSFSEEVKKSQSELDEFLQELDEDVEGMQSTIYYLQQELRKSKETVASLQAEVSALRSGGTTALAPTSADVKQEKVELAEELVCKAESPPAQEAAADPVPLTVEDQDQPVDEWKDVKPVPSVPSPSPTITIKTEPEDEDSSGSAELILKVEADELGPEAEFETEAVQEVQPVPECGEGKKRLFVNDDSSGDDSDNVPLIKKVRRDSELSLHYNEDEDEDEATRLINVNSAGQNNVQE